MGVRGMAQNHTQFIFSQRETSIKEILLIKHTLFTIKHIFKTPWTCWKNIKRSNIIG
jgi:hypothetical protein